MTEIKQTELYNINGGAINYTMLKAIARAASTLYTIGQAIGSAVRRMISNKYC